MKRRTTFTATTAATQIAGVTRPNRNINNYIATIMVSGTNFGGGSVNLFLSPDRGVTLIPLTTTPGGSAVAFTAQGSVLLNLGTPNRNTDTLDIYASVTGATAPAPINVDVYDNNG